MEPDEPGAGGPARRERSGRYVARHRRQPTDRRGARRLLIAVNVLVGLSLVAGVLVAVYAEVQLHRIRHVPVRGLKPGQTQAAGSPVTVLIVGSDTRAGLTEPGDSAFGSPSTVGGARSDTIMLARIVPASRQIELLSIPRDLYVPVAGMGRQKINAAFDNGPNRLIQTIKQQLGIEIDHYVDVDFDTFREIADAVGGVPVYFPTAARDLYSDLGVGAPGQVPGCVNLTGDQALAYVRSREYQYWQDGEWQQEALSDLARIQRQQTFIRKLIKKAEDTGLSNPVQLSEVISGVTKNLTVDSGLSTSDMLALARDFAKVNADRLPGVTLATTAQTLSDGEDVLLPDTAQDQAQIAQFLAFGTKPAAGSTSPTPPPSGSTTTTTTPPVTVPPSSVAVEVANGTGAANQATQTSQQLEALGFDITATVDAPATNTGPTQVLYGPGAQADAQTVAAYVHGPTTVQGSDQLGSASVELVTGNGFTGISSTPQRGGSAAPGSSTSAPAPPAPTTSTTYVLPGTPPGQPVPTCGQ